MDKLIYFSSVAGGVLLAATLIWVAMYNFRQSQTRKGILFGLAGVSIAIILIYSILIPQ